MGRREAQDEILRQLALGVPLSRAAETAGVETSTVYRWRKADEAFADAFERAHYLFRMRMLRLCQEAAEGGSVAAQYWLDCFEKGKPSGIDWSADDAPSA